MADLKTTVTNLPENKVELKVEVPVAELQVKMQKTIKGLSRDIKMPGFRVGKVPQNLIVQRFGRDAILAQTLEDAMTGWVEQAIDVARVKPIDQPELQVDELEDDSKPFTFKVTVPVMPPAEVGEYVGVEAQKDVVPVLEEDIDERVDQLRKRLSRLEEVSPDRPAREGDYTRIDFAGFMDGEPLEGGAGQDYMLELGSSQFIPGFEEQIAGMEKGQSKKLKLTFPQEYKPEELAGREVEFDVTVKEIKERVMPEADDGFAAENSEFDTIAAMRADIRTGLEQAREEEAELAFRQQAVAKVVADATVTIPGEAQEKRAHEIEMDFLASLQARGVGADEYLKQSEEDQLKFREHFQSQAVAALRYEAVLEAVAEKEQLDVTDEEIDAEISKAAPRMNKEPEVLIAEMREKGRTGIVRDDLIHRKAADFIADKAVAVPAEAGATPVEEKETAAPESAPEAQQETADADS
ncbi:MAG: trigger factor [Thermoleophilia bacterium]